MSFVTDDVIQKLLRARDPKRVVADFEWEIEKRDSAKGFCSGSFHVSVLCKLLDGDRVYEYFFVKDPYSSALYPTIKHLGVYENELYVYKKILPALHRLLGEECLAPKYCWSDTEHAIILEDLSRDNYRNVDRRKQMDFEHTVRTLKQLAKLHAASVRLNEISPDLLNEAKRNPLHRRYFQVPEGREYFANHLKAALRSVYAEQVESREAEFRMYEGRFIDKLARIVNEDTRHSFNVLAHADVWTNNIMFKYKHGDIEDIKLVDFQLSHWTTPIVDLFHFIVVCVRFDVFQKQSDLFLEIYVNTLNRVLASLGSDTCLPLDELEHTMFDQSLDYGVFIVSYALSLALADDEAAESGNVNALEHMESESYKTLAFKWLSYFDRKGVFSRQ